MSQTPARFLLPASVRTSWPPSAKRSLKIGVFGPFLVGTEVAQPTGAHQVDHQNELAVIGREEQSLRPPPGAGEARAVERRERRVERLQRRDVGRSGLLDRASRHLGVEELPPGLDFGQLGHERSVTVRAPGAVRR